MNILFISKEYPPQTGNGGIGTYTKIIAESLCQKSHDVDIVTLSEKEYEYEYKENHVKIYRILPGQFILPKQKIFYPLRKKAYKCIYNTLVKTAWAKSVQKKIKILTKHKHYDIIEAAECEAEALFIKPIEKTKLVIRLHTPWAMVSKLDNYNETFLDTKMTSYFEKSTSLRADGLSAPSFAIKKELEKKWKLKNVFVYPNPMDVNKYLMRDKHENYIIYIGRVEYRKGVHVLIKAFAETIKSFPEFRLKMIGFAFGKTKNIGTYKQYILNMIEELNLKNHVEWIEKADRNDVKKYLSQAFCAVLPSIWENYPYTCLEAMSSGVPVITSDAGGFPEIITNEKTGLLFKAQSQKSLYSALEYLIQNKDLAMEMAKNAREWVEKKCDADKIADIAVKYYSEIINE